ncbi:hypothetical protein V1478_015983 [Vespula squamosa]|uniref:Uncharacterized protein n=1 Tax=Vespula squamosa TaxID=30214 RepID=A0ABD2A2E0_VESSQ
MRVAVHESRPCALGPRLACRIYRRQMQHANVEYTDWMMSRRASPSLYARRRREERSDYRATPTIVGQFEKILTSLSGFASFGLQPFGAFNPLIAEPEGSSSITKKHFEPFQACLTKRSSRI